MDWGWPPVVPSTRPRRKKESVSVDDHSVPHTDKLSVSLTGWGPWKAPDAQVRGPDFKMTTQLHNYGTETLITHHLLQYAKGNDVL